MTAMTAAFTSAITGVPPPIPIAAPTPLLAIGPPPAPLTLAFNDQSACTSTPKDPKGKGGKGGRGGKGGKGGGEDKGREKMFAL